MSNIQIKLTEFSDFVTCYTADFMSGWWLLCEDEREGVWVWVDEGV